MEAVDQAQSPENTSETNYSFSWWGEKEEAQLPVLEKAWEKVAEHMEANNNPVPTNYRGERLSVSETIRAHLQNELGILRERGIDPQQHSSGIQVQLSSIGSSFISLDREASVFLSALGIDPQDVLSSTGIANFYEEQHARGIDSDGWIPATQIGDSNITLEFLPHLLPPSEQDKLKRVYGTRQMRLNISPRA